MTDTQNIVLWIILALVIVIALATLFRLWR